MTSCDTLQPGGRSLTRRNAAMVRALSFLPAGLAVDWAIVEAEVLEAGLDALHFIGGREVADVEVVLAETTVLANLDVRLGGVRQGCTRQEAISVEFAGLLRAAVDHELGWLVLERLAFKVQEADVEGRRDALLLEAVAFLGRGTPHRGARCLG